MEIQVERIFPGIGANDFLGLVQQVTHPRCVFGIGPLRCEARDRALEDLARLRKLEERLRGAFRDVRATTWDKFDETFGGQDTERFPDRGSADMQLLRQHLLVDSLADTNLSAENVLAQYFRYAVS
jgi:hypothetical protein